MEDALSGGEVLHSARTGWREAEVRGRSCAPAEDQAFGSNCKLVPFMQKRSPVGLGPSGKMWPRCAPQLAQWASTRTMPCERSTVWATDPSIALKKLGQPEPDSYLASAVNSSAPHEAQ